MAYTGYSRMYECWRRMRQRCLNPNHRKFKHYGGRGITVCERWNRFENFLADMGECPNGKSLDRINNNGNYEPSNCRWATPAQQRLNQRRTVLVEYRPDEPARPIEQWAKRQNINPNTMVSRLRSGWPLEKALETPVRTRRR